VVSAALPYPRAVTNQLFELELRVLRDQDGSDLPAGADGAYVACYSCAPDLNAALTQGAAAVARMGCRIDDVEGDARVIPVDRWSEFVAKVWPEYASNLPNASQLPARIAEGAVFFGPFATFSRG
jgi:hypothetical protein